MEWNGRLWRRSVERFKAFMIPLAVPLGRSERRMAAASYVSGLLMPGQRKSIEPMAARLGLDPQRLQQFITESPCEDKELWRVIRREVIPSLNFFVLTIYLEAKENFWSDVGEDPRSDPALATEIDRTLSLLPTPLFIAG